MGSQPMQSQRHVGFDDPAQGRSRRFVGLALVVLLHVLAAWGLMSGLARETVERVRKPVQVAIVDEERPVVPPPPAPAPPPAAPTPPPPALQQRPPPAPSPPAPAPAPAPARPEVVEAPAAPAPALPSAPERQVERAAAAASPSPAPAPPSAATSPAPAARPAPRVEIAIVCPGYQEILQGALAGQWDRVGITGVVKVLIRVRGNQILEVIPQSGPREYYRAVQNAVRRMKCTLEGAEEQSVPLEVGFRES